MANPSDYALIYGSPVPGYRAPEDTIGPASRVSMVALGLVADAFQAGEIDVGPVPDSTGPAHDDFDNLRVVAGLDLPDEVLARLFLVWTQLLGGISYELFGHLHGIIGDADAYFEDQMARSARVLIG